ncbi:bifunctional DNA primase/polymerase [Solirhodobacter olei]|uniref:bifunctional DNA primase/polymerase n=1 Tax=Solirhodobacter olei TaxID=2493082 RepID=UPI000FD84474|nr:bifunctional DNA primase/polymerase [Solirhodobacter olei]
MTVTSTTKTAAELGEVHQAALTDKALVEQPTQSEAKAPTAGATPIPFDRLPVDKVFGAPPPCSLYHTRRAADARERAVQALPDRLDQARDVLHAVGGKRVNAAYADVFDHNTMTLAYALEYANHGLTVVDSHAVYPNSGEGTGMIDGKHTAKVPRGAGWQDRATIIEDEITDAWIGEGEYPPNKKGKAYPYAKPGAPRNVSIVFQQGCHMFALDEDGDEGMEAVRKLEAEHGPLPKTATSVSGSGKGQHRLFRCKRPILNTGGKIAPKVDIRGEGGQIIAAPSVHESGGYYQWKPGCAPWECEIADAPEWLEEQAFECSKVSTGKASTSTGTRRASNAAPRTYTPGDRVYGFDAKLAIIGDGDGLCGFDGPIYSAACSWFRSRPHGDPVELFDILRNAILAAPCDDDRAETRYATDEYLWRRIEQAQDWGGVITDEAEDEAEEAAPEVENVRGQADGTQTLAAGSQPEDAESAAKEAEEAENTGLVLDEAEAAARAAAKFEAWAKGTTRNTPEREMRDRIAEAFAAGVPLDAWGRAKDDLARHKIINRRVLQKMWDVHADAAEAQEQREAKTRERNKRRASVRSELVRMIDLDGKVFRVVCDNVAAIMADQGDDPELFHSMGRIVDVQENEHGLIRIKNVDKERFKAKIEARVDFFKDDASVPASKDLTNNVFNRDKTAYPPLLRVISSPVYSEDKSLVTKTGYHKSGLYYQPVAGVEALDVPDEPTEAQVKEAVTKLVDLLADFPLDALSREEMTGLDRGGKQTGPGIVGGLVSPSFAHAMSMGLTPLCREFINGPTPGHLARKDKPRTGASKLISTVSYIATMGYAAAQSLPDSKDEVRKTIVTELDKGMPFIFFDNLPATGKVDFGELAGAMTAWPYYSARRLNTNDTIEARVRATWAFTGIRTMLSEELSERMLLIDLDPQMENPGDRPESMFKYDLETQIAKRGPEYLRCLLVLVQNWIAVGCPERKEKGLAGFERHSKIIGGILEAAGIKGFLGNRAKLRSTTTTETPDTGLIDAMIAEQKVEATLFRINSTERAPQFLKSGGEGKEKAKPFPYAGHRVLSIIGILTDEEIALPGCGYVWDGDAIRYGGKAINAVSQRITSMVGTVREHDADHEESEDKQGRYILTKVHADKHGALYAMERKPLIKGDGVEAET